MPSYNNNVPTANQTIASSQVPINTNFASIKTLIDINHYDFGNALYGKHFMVEMPNQSSNPAGAATEMTLFSKQYAPTTQSEAFIVRDVTGASAPNLPIPFTASGVTGGAGGGIGWYFLPCGLLIKFGQVTITAASQTVTASQGPTITTLLNVSLTLTVSANPQNYHFAATSPFSGNSFNVVSSATGFALFYTLIGTATP